MDGKTGARRRATAAIRGAVMLLAALVVGALLVAIVPATAVAGSVTDDDVADAIKRGFELEDELRRLSEKWNPTDADLDRMEEIAEQKEDIEETLRDHLGEARNGRNTLSPEAQKAIKDYLHHERTLRALKREHDQWPHDLLRLLRLEERLRRLGKSLSDWLQKTMPPGPKSAGMPASQARALPAPGTAGAASAPAALASPADRLAAAGAKLGEILEALAKLEVKLDRE